MDAQTTDTQNERFRHAWHNLLAAKRTIKMAEAYSTIHDLPPAETGLIDIIAENPEIILREIGVRLNLCKSTLSSMVDRLERRGLLRRVITPRDRRSYGIELTEAGRQAYETHLAFENDTWGRALAHLEPGEIEQLVALLDKTTAALLAPMEIPQGTLQK